MQEHIVNEGVGNHQEPEPYGYPMTAAIAVRMGKEQCPSCNGGLIPSGRGLIEAAGFGIIPGIDTSKGDGSVEGGGGNPRYMMGEPLAPFRPRYGVQCVNQQDGECQFIGSIEISVEEADELRGKPLDEDQVVLSDG